MKNNKGFSMVELIVVIAIMVIVAGCLAPTLVKYINKAKLSVDIKNGKEIAKAIMVAVTEENVKDNAVEHATPQKVENMDGSDFKDAVFGILGVDKVEGKSKKDAEGNTLSDPVFYYTLDSSKNKVEVYYGGITDEYKIYPTTGEKLVK